MVANAALCVPVVLSSPIMHHTFSRIASMRLLLCGTDARLTERSFERVGIVFHYDLCVPSRMITLTLGARPFSWHVRF